MANSTEIKNLQELIQDSIGGEVVEQKGESLLPPGENFGSVMYKVDFKVKKDGKVEEYHAVAKCTPPNNVTQEIFNTQVSFKTEIGWYTTVIPTLKQFQKDHGVEKEIDFFQPFYGARISLDPKSDKVDLDGVMFTQNLKYLGYFNEDRHVGFDLPTSYTILRDLATFHAVPLAIKRENPELFNKNIKPNLSFNTMDDEMRQGFLKPLFNAFEQIPEVQPIMDKINKNINEANLFGPRPLREPWVTVIHMDFWMNNIMVTGGENSKTMILDLSMCYLGNPAADLIFFLLTSVKLDVVRDKLDEFVEFYYKQFIKNLKELNAETDDYTLEGLLKEIETELKIGEFGHSLFFNFTMLIEKGQTNFDSSNENFKKEDIVEDNIVINAKQIEKFRWIATEADKRNWI